MLTERLLAVTVGLGAALAIGAACSATGDPDFSGDDGVNGPGSGGMAASSGVQNGGNGGAIDGGGGTIIPSICDIDCTMITTDQCLEAVCNEGQHPGVVGACVVVPVTDGEGCDDGVFCTAIDTCQAGVCTGAGLNTCGMNPPPCNEVSCNEASQNCGVAPAMDGSNCQSADLCTVGSQCSNGQCVGGVTNDCFFSPVPNDCHVAVCDPTTGQCEPEPGNNGAQCTDQNDLCTIGNTCAAGVCGGGTPKDCSALTMGCFDGQCDMLTGQCAQVPIMPGGQCAAATDQCNVGICDMNGMCNPMPTNQGQACDTDGCFVGQTCNNGNCQGGGEITACMNNDNCCPNACDISNDDDCGCDFGLISNESQLADATITGLLTAAGHTFVNHDNNNTGTHTENLGLLNMYETIILHEHDRLISATEMNNLISWVAGGGRLLVTGYDSLGSPTDNNMANVVNCTSPGDGPFSNAMSVTNAVHPILQGPAQAFPFGTTLTAGSTDHDQCTPGVGAINLITISTSTKLVVTDNAHNGSGVVIYWNGNGTTTGPLVDWVGTAGTQPDLQNLFVNVLDHMCQF